MLVGMRMRPFRLAGERFDSTIITFQPKIDVGTSSVIFAGLLNSSRVINANLKVSQ